MVPHLRTCLYPLKCSPSAPSQDDSSSLIDLAWAMVAESVRTQLGLVVGRLQPTMRPLSKWR
jgi:hypothetical protein